MTSAIEDTAPKISALTGGSLLARNAVFNMVGQGIPMLVALITIPLLIHGLGTDRFGVLTIAWMVIGYFSLFDLGLGRALTQVVSERLGAEREDEVPALVWTGLAIMAVLGVFGALVLVLLSPWLVHSVLKIPVRLQTETLYAFYLLAASIPIVISTAGLAGILSALQRFDILNAIRIPMGIFSFIGPLLVLPFSQSLFLVTTVLMIGRVVAWAIHLIMCLRIMPTLSSGFSLQRALISPLFRFGGWMTVTNVVGPLMVYLDRIVIGGVISVAAVAYYATPYELITKLLIIPGAIVGVLFPAFASMYAQDRQRTALLFVRGTKYVFLALFPLTLAIVAFAHEGLRFWLGADFAQHSTPVLQWLAVGVFINGLAQLPFALLQGAGRPDLTAKIHLLELPIYLTVLWVLLHEYGIMGVAWAWVIRAFLDMSILFALALLHFKLMKKQKVILCVVFMSIPVVFALALISGGLMERLIYLGFVLSTYIGLVLSTLMEPREKLLILNFFKK